MSNQLMPVSTDPALAAQLSAALSRMGLLRPGDAPAYEPLTGGVGSEIWRVDLPGGPICLKRALPKLSVKSEWYAPAERWRYEVSWFRTVEGIVPHAIPRVLGEDDAAHLFALEYLDPSAYRLWRSELARGRADENVAATVGNLLATIHSATANRPDLARAFPSDAIFSALRLHPYLETTAEKHPELAERLRDLARIAAATKLALVHGDVSPKNIFLGPQGPVFVDAECAWYGDPAFDVAFCLNHMLLKCLWVPQSAPGFLACFDALRDAYLAGVTWEPKTEIETRAAGLLPGLFLARVDGKSPVEYLTDERDKERVRRTAASLLASPPPDLASVRRAWAKELGLAR